MSAQLDRLLSDERQRRHAQAKRDLSNTLANVLHALCGYLDLRHAGAGLAELAGAEAVALTAQRDAEDVLVRLELPSLDQVCPACCCHEREISFKDVPEVNSLQQVEAITKQQM